MEVASATAIRFPLALSSPVRYYYPVANVTAIEDDASAVNLVRILYLLEVAPVAGAGAEVTAAIMAAVAVAGAIDELVAVGAAATKAD